MEFTHEGPAKEVKGYPEAVLSSQATFRQVMNAFAHPGAIHTIADAKIALPLLMPAISAIALTLFDHDTPIWIDPGFENELSIAEWLRFHTAAPVTIDASTAGFALIHSGSALPDFESFSHGSLEYPDRSATLIVQIDTLTDGSELLLEGPGIRGSSVLRAGFFPSDFVDRMKANRQLFPRGVDLLLVCGTQVVALPRSIHIAAKEA